MYRYKYLQQPINRRSVDPPLGKKTAPSSGKKKETHSPPNSEPLQIFLIRNLLRLNLVVGSVDVFIRVPLKKSNETMRQNGTKNIKTYCIPTCGQCLFSLHVIHLHFTTPRNMFCRPSSSPSAASLDRACGGTEGWLIFIYTCDFLCEFGICILLHTACMIVNLHYVYMYCINSLPVHPIH